MQTQYSIIGYKTDLYFHQYKLAIEVDELGHNDKNIYSKNRKIKSNRKRTWLCGF